MMYAARERERERERERNLHCTVATSEEILRKAKAKKPDSRCAEEELLSGEPEPFRENM
jgi:hypothetical protein